MDLLGAFIKAVKPRFDDDIVDRIHNYYTVLMLALISIVLTAKQYVGTPIKCWGPAQFTKAWVEYSEFQCFVENTYWLPMNDEFPKEASQREAREIGYYQWVPIVLAFQALMFYIPRILWRTLNWQSGIHVKRLIGAATDTKNIDLDERKKVVNTIAIHLRTAVDYEGKMRQGHSFPLNLLNCGKGNGIYVTLLYHFIKLIYIVNVVGQLVLMNRFLGPSYQYWGLEILDDLLKGKEWDETGHFPRVTVCDFSVRALGQVHDYSVQCVLMINMFIEKVYLFLWWWFVVLSVATILSFIYWLTVSIVSDMKRDFVKKFIRAKTGDDVDSDKIKKKRFDNFIENYLTTDGVFILRLIAANAGDIFCMDIINSLWKEFKATLPAEKPAMNGGHGDTKALLDSSKDSNDTN